MLEPLMRKLPTILLANEMSNLCQSLFETIFKTTPINYFSYAKVDYKNKKYCLLMNDGLWAEHYIIHDYYIFDLCHSYPSSGYFIWSAQDMIARNPNAMHTSCIAFGYNKGITFVQKSPNHTEYYAFSMQDNADIFSEFLITKIELFYSFILNFKQSIHRSKNLLEAYNKKLPFDADLIQNNRSFKNEIMSSDENIVKRFYLGGDFDDIYFTKREMDCLLQIAKGKTIKEVAKVLNISFRTIETYFEEIKLKTKCARINDIKKMLLSSIIFQSIL